jgi:hypothetical protein
LACCISTCIFVDVCIIASTTLSSLVSFCIAYVSTKCSSTTLSSSDSSMNIESSNVALSPLRSLARQCYFLLHKNSTSNFPVVFMS